MQECARHGQPEGGSSARLKNLTNQAEIPSVIVPLAPNRRNSHGRTASMAISVICPRVIVVEIQARGKPRALEIAGHDLIDHGGGQVDAEGCDEEDRDIRLAGQLEALSQRPSRPADRPPAGGVWGSVRQ